MPLFTFLNHGTCANRFLNDGEIVAAFGANMDGEEYQDYLITDGVGSLDNFDHLLPGNFDPFDREKGPMWEAPEWARTHFGTTQDITGDPTIHFEPTGHGVVKALTGRQKRGIITGAGWDDNIRHAISALTTAWWPNLNGTINMIGWSRGAVTCLRLANWIKEFLGDQFEINIFAVDPVAGLDTGTNVPDTYTIPDIVRNYVAVLAMNEYRGDFLPQDKNRIRVENNFRSKVAFLPFPGNHSNVAKVGKDQVSETPLIVRHLAYKFLSHFGTQFITPERLFSGAELCDMYAAMARKYSKYKALGKSKKNMFMGGSHKRDVLVQRSQYVHGNARFFVNEHHRHVFSQEFPTVYAYMFTRSVNHNGNTQFTLGSSTGRAFQDLATRSPESAMFLRHLTGLDAERVRRNFVWVAPPPGCLANSNLTSTGNHVAPLMRIMT